MDELAMDLNVDSPIAALASPPGGSLRGIVRISGDRVRNVLIGWFDPDDVDAWNSARSARSHSGVLYLDSGAQQPIRLSIQALLWPNQRSYTGQPLIELHVPGSPCLLEAVLGEAYRHGARPARPGEFTMRAFLAGKLDLLQAEAVLGVIDARDHQELQTALAQLAGGVSGKLGQLRRDLLELLADLEAGLDFVDEDIEFVSRREVVDRLTTASKFVGELLSQTQDRMQSHVRPKVVLAGLPNAGKSMLFNRLAGDDAALVSPEQGTTRDFLTREATWDDMSFDLIDTAGWEDNSIGIAAEAQSQRTLQFQQSDLLVWCSSALLNDAEKRLDDELFERVQDRSAGVVRLLTKIDLVRQRSADHSNALTPESSYIEASGPLRVSAVTGVGLSVLRNLLRSRLCGDAGKSRQWLGTTAARCRETLESVSTALERAGNAARVRESGDELIAVDLRDALNHLGVILGVIYTDDILDRIFSKFCIGK